jgi:hypothetical protein
MMNAKYVHSLLETFEKTLDDKKENEWWGTDRGVWLSFVPQFKRFLIGAKGDQPSLLENRRIDYEQSLLSLSPEERMAELKRFCNDMMDMLEFADEQDVYIRMYDCTDEI